MSEKTVPLREQYEKLKNQANEIRETYTKIKGATEEKIKQQEAIEEQMKELGVDDPKDLDKVINKAKADLQKKIADRKEVLDNASRSLKTTE